MKIVFFGNFGRGWDNSICDEVHISDALEELGHEVVRCQREERPILNERYDFVLMSQWDGYGENLIRDLHTGLNIPVVYWSYDYQADGQEWHERLVKESDLYLSKRIADSKYPNWQWLSQDFAPSFLDKHPTPIEKDIDVLFTGSYLDFATERNETLKAVDEKFNLVIHSVNAWEGFKDVRPPIMDEGLPELYARAKVILSIDHTLEAGYWSDRPAQVMCCGGFVLHRYQPLCETVFRNHIGYFYNKEDCLKQLEELLTQPDEDLQIVLDGAYEYAQNYLKVENRVLDLLTIVREKL